MLFVETGVIPISILIKSRIISFWNRLVTGKDSINYNYLIKFTSICSDNQKEFKWLKHIKTILESSGRTDIWLLQPFLNTPNLGNNIKTSPHSPKLPGKEHTTSVI